jgi:hypothetical protein
MKKLLPLLVVGTLVLSGLGAIAFRFDKIKTDAGRIENEIYNISLYDELDQYQTNYDEECPGPIGYYFFNTSWNISIAQSFTPTKEILTRVVLYVGKNVTASCPYVLAIRDNLTGENLALTSLNPYEFMVIPNLSWIEFDFDDIIISIGETYYMVSYTSNITDNTYLWGAICSDVYPNGTAYLSADGGKIWETPPHADLCFMTYGRNNQSPTAPIINGKTRGKAGKEYEYIFNATDPDGDNVKYYINWGDNTTYEADFNSSGTEVMVKHKWTEDGTYNITAKAEDINGAQGPEGKLTVTMPKSKSFYFNFNILEWIFERFLNLFPIFRYILGL